MMTAEPSTGRQNREQRMMAIRAAAGSSGTWDWDILDERLYLDAHFAELCGVDPADGLTGLPTDVFFRAIHREDRARIRIAVAGILGGAELFSKEFRVVAPDGAVLWMHGRGQCEQDADDQPVRFTGLLVDVTDRKRTEERLRIAQSAGGVGTFEHSDGFATMAVSEEFCRVLGLHPAPVLPVQTVNAVMLPGEAPLIPSHLPDAGVSGLEAEFRILRADDGAERWIARRGEVVRDGAGYRLVGVIYDVTKAKELEAQLRDLNDTLEARVEAEVVERHQAQESLRQAQKMEAVGHLTGGIAHDFNNLLMIIIGNIDTVRRRIDASGDPRLMRSLDNAMKGAESAAALTQRLLVFSRQQPLDPRAIDVARLLAGMSDLLTRSITEAVSIQITSTAELWPIEADAHQLENAILNLAVNARDAMDGSGALTVAARNVTVSGAGAKELTPGDYVAIGVTDTGSGMSAETIAKVFDPFFTTKEVGKGTGLGLSMVYGFAQQSKGGVYIDSVIGEGTTVTLYLPRAISEMAAPAEAVEAVVPMGSASETVLVVEDNDDVRAYTVGVLRELGYRVIEAYDGAAGLRLLEKQDRSIQLLLTDVVMPEMSGPALVEAARRLQPDLKVLYNSGYTRDAIMRDGKLEPGVDLIAKPFTFMTLAAKVRELLDR
ncbi:hybrid sensor histidine kinase/response regulator [Sphingomonas sp. Root1294]|uniref:hybrid sensor histidine kinase/response regulator n=2 Tax=Sphingomonas TaxID=13687 RepID=UPI000AD74359|nr:hybrid sensor histidine kinase/response regulator [Sphingomonas sp. Root1294]